MIGAFFHLIKIIQQYSKSGIAPDKTSFQLKKILVLLLFLQETYCSYLQIRGRLRGESKLLYIFLISAKTYAVDTH